jgi:thioredoxin reductase (NADPH)
VVGVEGELELERLTLRGGEGEATVAADALFLLIGAQPRTEWLAKGVERDERGFVLTGGGERGFETSMPGVFAIGDVRAGSVKRVASAVGEGSVVIQQVHSYLEALQASPVGT